MWGTDFHSLTFVNFRDTGKFQHLNLLHSDRVEKLSLAHQCDQTKH